MNKLFCVFSLSFLLSCSIHTDIIQNITKTYNYKECKIVYFVETKVWIQDGWHFPEDLVYNEYKMSTKDDLDSTKNNEYKKALIVQQKTNKCFGFK